MRLRRLDLERFGHFRGPRLEVPASASLCVVHGDNEAGKTTVLEAIRWLLFGGTGVRWAIDVDATQLAVSAAVEIGAGLAVDVRRSRGKGGGLRGTTATGDEVDEEWILGRLTRPSRAVFENVFGFSLKGLAEGASALAHEDLQNAIYGGGLGGGVHPDDILEDLRTEADKLFKERGHSQRVHLAAKRIEEFKARVRASTIRADEWQRLEGEVARCEVEAAERASRLDEKRREHDRLRRVLESIEPLRARDAARDELEAIRAPAALPEGAATIHARLVSRRDALAQSLASTRATIAEADAILAATIVDDAVLAARVEVEAVARGIERYESARAEHPARVAELDAHARLGRDRLADLRPGWDLERLRVARLDAAARAELDAACARHDALEAEAESVGAQIDALERELRDLDARAAAIPAPVEVAPLRAWLEGWSGWAAEHRASRELDERIRLVEVRHASLRRRLDPPLAAAHDPRTLAVLRVEEIDAWQRDLDAAAHERARVVDQRAGIEVELRAVEARLAEIAAEGVVPTEPELRALRARRDALWSSVAGALGGAPERDPGELARAFERASEAADDAVDRMRVRADAVSRRTIDEARRVELERARASLEAKATEHEEAREALRARYRAAWARAGIEPLEPAAMRAWLADREAFLACDDELGVLRDRREARAAEIEPYVRRGAALLGASAHAALEGAMPDELRGEAARRIEEEERRARERESLGAQRARDRAKLDRLLERRAVLATERAALAEAWPPILARLGIDPDLSIVAARAVVAGLAELRQALVLREEPLRALVERLSSEVASFEARVRAVWTATSAEPPPEEAAAARALEARLVEARAAHDRRERALRDREVASLRSEGVSSELSAVEAELAALRALADVADDDAFVRVVSARARADEAARRLEAAERALDRLRGDEPLDAWSAAVGAVEPDAARDAIARAKSEIQALEREVRELERGVGESRGRLAVVDGRVDAAEAQADLEQTRAGLREEVERWAVLTLSESILRSAIVRFEREHQPELLERASRVFSRMTLGRYARVRKSGRALVCERDDGREIPPDVLSTGTCEQLYLAIRLAYIELYCRGAEPLPVVLDDVLVDFDDRRARATLEALAEFAARTTQVLLFTCHDRITTIAREPAIGAATLTIPATGHGRPAPG